MHEILQCKLKGHCVVHLPKKDRFSNLVRTITALIFQDVQLSKNRTSVFFYFKFGLCKKLSLQKHYISTLSKWKNSRPGNDICIA